MRSSLQRGALVLAGVIGLLGTRPATANAQKALVYCPVTIDATGCNAIVNALTGTAYPLGVDRGYDGTAGTVDLKAVDLFSYSVFVVPSLADDPTSQPYGMLRDPEVAEHLKAALIGRLAMWSGSPDQGATNRALKDALIQNLAAWAGGAFATAKGPGLVALLDASSSTTARYDWVRAITPVPVTSDPNLLIYSSVRALNARATTILTSAAGPIAYDNVATFGFQVPNGAPGVNLDAIGQTGTTQGGQVVLLTMEAGNSSGALVKTDRNDYAPGEVVTMTGSGWQPGEMIKLSLHMDPLRDSDTELMATADANGNFTNTDFAPAEYDLRVRFVLTAIGQASGRRAQTTFTDSRTINSVTLNGGTSVTVSAGESITAVVNVTTDNSGGNQNWRSTGWLIGTAPGVLTCVDHPNHDGSGTYAETFSITAPTTGTYNAYFVAYANETCSSQPSSTFTLTNAVTVVGDPTITTISPSTKVYGDAAFTLTVNGTNFTATSTVRFNGSNRSTSFVSSTQLTASIAASDLLAVGDFPITVRSGGGAISNAVNLSVTAKSITGNFTAQNKVYDGSTSATILTRTLTGVVGTDDVSLTGGTASFASKTVAAAKSVTATGFTLTGTQAANYTLASTTLNTTADITPATVTGAFTAQTRVYDGTTAATIDTRSLTGVIAPDVVTLASGTATFANKNVGAGKTVTGTGFTLAGADAGNYVLASTTLTTTADITARALAVTGTGINKFYDGTTAATVTLADDRVVGDVFVTSYASAAFADKNVGTTKPIDVTGISVSGTDAGNYTANTTCTTSADITAKPVTGSFTADNKVYDGNTSATISARNLTGIIVGDVVSLTGGTATFDTKAVGTGKTVNGTGFSITGADAGNYALAAGPLTTTANITARTLGISATGIDKVYDGTTAATVTLSDDRVSGDVFTDSYTTAAFADKTVGTAKSVSVAGISISGADAGNYTFNTTASTIADITARALTITATGVNKVYDGTTDATVTLGDNRVAGDVLATAYTTAAFSDKNVGAAKTVNVTGITLGGADAGNYTFNTTTTASANITARSLAVTATGVNKVYDATTTATVTFADDRVAGDVLTVTGAASFADKNVGTGKTVTVNGIALTGTDAGNYAPNTSTTTTADITQRQLTITPTGVDKIYDATTAATVTLADDRIAGDAFTDSYTSATFGDKNVGAGKTVSVSGISISGADAPNYAFNTTASATANITSATLVGSFTVNDKVYDGNTTAAIATRDVTGVLPSDNANLTGGSATFADKNVGTNKTVTGTGFTISGSDAGNYVLQSTTLTTQANITARALTISATGVNKVYDGTAAATVNLTDDRVGGDDMSDSYTSAAFADKNVGASKVVSVSGISVSGADAANYTFNSTASTTADITAKSITGSFTADNKVYDGGTDATVLTRSLTGTIAGDAVSLTGGTATFADKSVANGKTVTLTGASLTGADAANYMLASVATASANITERTLIVSAAGANKVYDGMTTATVTLSDNRVSGDVFTDSYTSATFDTKNVGVAKPISVSGLSISGTDAANYTVNTTASTAADITARALSISATAQNKIYDGNPTATVTLSDDRVAGDVFTDSYTSATFADQNAANGKVVTVTGISISGTDAGNYTYNNTATTTANIAKKALTITADDKSHVFNGAVFPGPYTATFNGLVPIDQTAGQPNAGVIGGLTYGGAAITAINAGAYPIAPSGATAGNYTITLVNGTLTIVDESAPIVSAVAATPNPVAMGNAFVLTATISDATTGNSNITVAEYSTTGGATWAAMDNFTSAPTVNVSKTLTLTTGVYNVCVRGKDAPGNTSVLTEISCTLVAVYDPTAGFVTGGGWIMSPRGAYVPGPMLEGKATFGFVSKYQKGQMKPTGSTEFQFHAAAMNFKSVDYEWLVISGTTRAQYKGTGTLNGAGNYGFLLSAIDGDNFGSKKPDTFRIKIWDVATGTIVYDNQIGADDTADPTTIISGGSIQIQAK